MPAAHVELSRRAERDLRELTIDELPAGAAHGRRIARIVHRGDLHRAAGTLT